MRDGTVLLNVGLDVADQLVAVFTDDVIKDDTPLFY